MSFAIVQSNISAGTLSANSLIVPSKRQLAQVALVQEYAKCDDLETLALSLDKSLANFVITSARIAAIQSACADYQRTGNPSNLARLVNGIIGTLPIPKMPVKAAELALYQHTIATWCRTNGKQDRAAKTQTLYAERTALLSPVFDAITWMAEHSAKKLETQPA